MRPLTAFTWGYAGWGNALPELISLFDSTEGERGFAPPLFIDIRARRQVRAVGFSGSPPPFAKRLRSRYRWLPDLGNEAILRGSGPMRLIDANAAWELLGLVLRGRAENRRVARRVGLSLETPEWTQNASKQS